MQPYFFPYIGYFQLMSACDVFIVADDVQYIEQGWVNRNRILINAAPVWLTMPVVEQALGCGETGVATFNTEALRAVARYLGISTPVIMASALPPSSATGATRVIQRCHQVGASDYINAIGGLALYSQERFAADGVSLRFLEPFLPEYAQFGQRFVPALSVIDVMMFNEPASIAEMLRGYTLPWRPEERGARQPASEARLS